jgi:hypothetical protein
MTRTITAAAGAAITTITRHHGYDEPHPLALRKGLFFVIEWLVALPSNSIVDPFLPSRCCRQSRMTASSSERATPLDEVRAFPAADGVRLAVRLSS